MRKNYGQKCSALIKLFSIIILQIDEKNVPKCEMKTTKVLLMETTGADEKVCIVISC